MVGMDVMISLHFLADDVIVSIHKSTIRVLEETGLRVSNEEARNLLVKEGCTTNGDIVKIPKALVEDSIQKVPSNFAMYNFEGEKSWQVGLDRVIFNPASSAVYFKDRETQDIRKGKVADVVELVRLVEGLEYVGFQSTALVPSDVPEPISGHYRLFLTLMNSTKPIVTGAFSKDGLNEMKLMLEVVTGGSDELARRPRAIFDCCPTSPLTWGDTACQNLMDCADAGIPAAIVPAPLSGATSPITIHGTLIQSNAEILTGVVLSQLKRPGSPIIYGGAAGSFDMKYGTPRFGAVEAMMTSCASAELGKHYGFPTHSYLGGSDSKAVDAQSGYESGLGFILGALARINVISGPGMLAHLNCQSLEKLVIDNEICGTAFRLIRGVGVETIEAITELISNVGSDGDYLRQKHTSKMLRSEHFMPSSLIDRLSTDSWRAEGSKDILERARERVSYILKDHSPIDLSPDLEKEMKSVMEKVAAKYKVSLD